MKRNMVIIICCLFSSFGLSSNAVAGDVNLMVAASLKDVMQELAGIFGKKNPGTRIVTNPGASGVLARQIENAAPADVFISANPKWMEYLEKKKMLAAASITTFAFNELVFAGNPDGRVRTMHNLVDAERIAIGSPKSVPAGEYAMEAFRKAGLDRLLGKKLVMARDVRECLMYAERGDVDGAIVYKTDALQLGKRTRIVFVVPQHLYSRVTYPMALTVIGSRKSEAVAFLNFLQSPETQAALEKYGFTVR